MHDTLPLIEKKQKVQISYIFPYFKRNLRPNTKPQLTKRLTLVTDCIAAFRKAARREEHEGAFQACRGDLWGIQGTRAAGQAYQGAYRGSCQAWGGEGACQGVLRGEGQACRGSCPG